MIVPFPSPRMQSLRVSPVQTEMNEMPANDRPAAHQIPPCLLKHLMSLERENNELRRELRDCRASLASLRHVLY